MKPLRLRARNLRTYPELDLEFGAGLVGILGELRDAPTGSSSNGSGKSTLLEAIDIALFGRRSLASYLTRGGDVDELMVELTFLHAESMYRVRRTYSARGRGKTSVDLEQHILHPHQAVGAGEEGGWIPITCASARETDEKLCAIIGLSRDTFRDSAYLRQGDGGYADPARDPRQRKQLLVEAVLGRDPVWPKLADIAKARRKQAEQQLERVRGESESLRELADQAQAAQLAARHAADDVTNAGVIVVQAEERHQAVAARYQQAREAAHARQTLEAELREATAVVATLQERQQKAEQARDALAAAHGHVASLATVDAAAAAARVDELRQAVAAHEAAARDHESARREQERRARERGDLLSRADQSDQFSRDVEAKASALEQAEQPHCQTCGQAVAGEAREKALYEYREEIASHRSASFRDRMNAAAIQDVAVAAAPEGEPPTAELRAAEADLRTAQESEKDRARLEERIRQLEFAAADTPAEHDLTDALARHTVKQNLLDALEPVSLDIIEQEGKASRVAVETARTARETAVAGKARADERLAQVKAAADKLAGLAAGAASLQAHIDRDLLLERAAGRDGIPALILENSAIPAIETEASRILHALGTNMQVELRTQAENKTGGLRDTLDVIVIKDGCECEYETGLSEGEKTRVALALRIGLARLLRHRTGGSEMLALDEPSFLDAAGMAALLDVLREIETSGEFSLVFLVSHVAELRDSLEQTITVIQENGVSRIDGTAVREAVPA